MTAFDLIEKERSGGYQNDQGNYLYEEDQIEHLMVEFAKYHVEQALSAAEKAAALFLIKYENGRAIELDCLGEETTTEQEDIYLTVNTKAIGSAYSTKNIK